MVLKNTHKCMFNDHIINELISIIEELVDSIINFSKSNE